MIDKIIFFIAVGVLVFLVAFAFFTPANAQSPFDIQYPVSELGNCGSQGECKTFCDTPANQSVCLDWAAKNGFIPKREVKRMKDMKKFEEKAVRAEPTADLGPGGCKTPAECDTFCKAPENLEPCLQYSVKHGYTTAKEADSIREQADKKGPGGCDSDRECRTFCDDPGNIEECMAFAVKEGKISKEEADFIIEQSGKDGGFGRPMGEEGARGPGSGGMSASPAGREDGGRGPGPKINKEKALKLLESEAGPGGCSTIKECGNYCDDPNNMEECANFAVKNNLVPKKEGEIMKKMLISGGPGGCKTPSDCDTFCSQPENMKECLNFAQENGFIPPEEAKKINREMDIMKKLDHRGGPDGFTPSFGGETPTSGDFHGQRGDFQDRRGNFSGKEKFPSQGEFSGDGQNPPKGENPRDFNRQDFEKFAPREGNYNRGDYKGGDFPAGAPENIPRNIPKNILEKMMKEGVPPPKGGIPPEGFTPQGGGYEGGGFGGPEQRPAFDGNPSGGFVEPGPVPGEGLPPDAGSPSDWNGGSEGFSEPTSMRSGSLIGAVLGPFLDIFSH